MRSQDPARFQRREIEPSGTAHVARTVDERPLFHSLLVGCKSRLHALSLLSTLLTRAVSAERSKVAAKFEMQGFGESRGDSIITLSQHMTRCRTHDATQGRVVPVRTIQSLCI